MHPIDCVIVIFYFVVVIAAGFWYQRRAAKDLESYFLGGKGIPWLMLAMSGSVSNFDITGTMFIVALVTYFGMNGMWYQWIWGFLMGAFFMAFMGKWIRRSGVMTGAEWMHTRFGTGRSGDFARLAYAVMAVVTLAAFIGYAFQGIGKFANVYTGVDPHACAAVIFAVTTLYVLLGGLYSVVLTDVIQTVVLSAAAFIIAGIAFTSISPEMLAERLPGGFASLVPPWRLDAATMERVAGTSYAGYEFFGALTLVWIVKGLLLNFGGPAQMYDFQRFLAARNPRDAAKIGAAWSFFLIPRWMMIMGIALLFLTGVAAAGDPEQVMPIVLQKHLPLGIRGLVIAGLLAAFMSTFSSTINAAASYLVRDIWQAFLRPDASESGLIVASYVATLGIVLIGVVIGLNAESIRAVFDWIMGALAAAFIVPNVLRWYWWRLNGWGYAVGTLTGLVAALIVPFIDALGPLYYSFPLVCVVSVLGTIGATFAFAPTDESVLLRFYETVRPFGAWGPVRDAVVAREGRASSGEIASAAMLNVFLGLVLILGIYLGPMYFVGRWFAYAGIWLGLAAVAGFLLYFTWYRTLPEAE